MKPPIGFLLIFLSMFSQGCAWGVLATAVGAGAAKNPSGLDAINHMTDITSDPPGARIEINNQYVGNAPLTLRIPRGYSWVKDDVFSPKRITGFESVEIVAYPNPPPPIEGLLYVQTRNLGSNEDTPSSLFFDMWLEPLPIRQEKERKVREEERQRKTYDALSSWAGHTKTELLEQWGPPTQVIAGKGQDVLVYDNSVQMTVPVGTGNQRIGLNVRSEKYVMFWIDREDRISKVTWKGQ